MTTTQPSYPLLDPRDLVSRDRIRLLPEQNLEPFIRAELSNLRRGVGYTVVVADTPQNRENIAKRAVYYQLAAYKEGWAFEPAKYEVRFVHPQDPVLRKPDHQSRICETKRQGLARASRTPVQPSSRNRFGYEINERTGHAVPLDAKEADGLVEKVLRLLR